MNEARELVDAGQVGMGLGVLSALSLVLAIALFAGFRKQPEKPQLLKGGLLAAAAVLLFPLWRVYNAIEDSFGLDSVLALVLNLFLFIVVGAVGGFAMRRFWPAESEH